MAISHITKLAVLIIILVVLPCLLLEGESRKIVKQSAVLHDRVPIPRAINVFNNTEINGVRSHHLRRPERGIAVVRPQTSNYNASVQSDCDDTCNDANCNYYYFCINCPVVCDCAQLKCVCSC